MPLSPATLLLLAFRLQALLFCGIPVTHGYGIVLKRLEVNRDAMGRSDLILGVVTLSDIPACVPGGHKARSEAIVNFGGLFYQIGLVCKKRKHCGFIRGETR